MTSEYDRARVYLEMHRFCTKEFSDQQAYASHRNDLCVCAQNQTIAEASG